MHRAAFWIALSALPLIHGCAQLPTEGEAGKSTVKSPFSLLEGAPSDRDLPQLLRFYREMEDWPERLLDGERRAQQAALVESRCDIPRLKLSLVLLRTAERGIKSEQHEELLKPCLQEADLADSGIQSLAVLLSTQLRDWAASHSRTRTNAQELEAMKKENQELKRQLEGLKAIERSLQDRRRR